MDKYLGKRLDGRYEMRELIGVGGMAYVYKAYDAVDDRIVAVKILKDEFLNSDEFVRRFRNESKAIAILNHPNIVKVVDVGFGERLQYIVMEYIDGITLKEYLDQRKEIRWKEAVHFTVQILRALQHAHDKGIVHRDIKPQNIMLLSDGTLKVMDFGIARLTRSDMKATVDGNKAIGSVHYISPEQARGEITDEKTDLYAVGIMLYETLTGCLPFEADNAVSVAIMQMQSEAKAPHLINAEIPEGLEQITLKAMQKDTAKRYQSAAEMLSDFEEFKKNPSIKFEYTYLVDETPTRYVDAITRVRGEGPEQTSKKDEPNVTKKKSANKKNTKTVSMIVILCLVTALAIGAVVWLVAWLINGGGRKQVDEVEVKNFIGMMYYTEIDGVAEYKEDFDLKIVWEDANNAERKVGEVFKQSPKNGKKVKKGSTVTLYVNNATPKEISLDVKATIEGEHKDDVRALLQEAGFEVKEELRSSEQFEADCVIKIDIEKGKSYPHGKIVTMTVSTGASPLDDIDIPDFIIGQTEEKAKEILKNLKYVGDPNILEVNYTDAAYAQEGIVMGVMLENELLTELPKTISPDADLTLVVSSGCKDVVVELDWPKDLSGNNVNATLGVMTWADGTPKSELAEHYADGKKPSSTSEPMTFTLKDHPSKKAYVFEVGIKLFSSTGDYMEYAKVKIEPTTGTWELVDDYKHLPGISPEAIIPKKMVGQSLTFKDIQSKLDGFKTVVIQQGNQILTQDNGIALTVEEILYNGEKVDGEKIKFGVALAADAEVTVKVKEIATAVIPSDMLGATTSYNDVMSKLNGFDKVTIKEGNKALKQDNGQPLMVDEIFYGTAKVGEGDVKFGVALPANVEVVVKVSTLPTATLPNLLDGTYTLTQIHQQFKDFDSVTVRKDNETLFEDKGEQYRVETVLLADGTAIPFGATVLANAEIFVEVSLVITDLPFPDAVFGQSMSCEELEGKFELFTYEVKHDKGYIVESTDIVYVDRVQYTVDGNAPVVIPSDNVPDTLPAAAKIEVFVNIVVTVPSTLVGVEWPQDELQNNFEVVFQNSNGEEIDAQDGWVIHKLLNEACQSVVGQRMFKGSTLIVVLGEPEEIS